MWECFNTHDTVPTHMRLKCHRLCIVEVDVTTQRQPYRFDGVVVIKLHIHNLRHFCWMVFRTLHQLLPTDIGVLYHLVVFHTFLQGVYNIVPPTPFLTNSVTVPWVLTTANLLTPKINCKTCIDASTGFR
uniref:Uncharacterized protein n=1 Tax=Lygus hesperus TaxID=30085 RepID=A0A146M162_LYGHE